MTDDGEEAWIDELDDLTNVIAAREHARENQGLERYVLGDLLGRGGMAEVYAAKRKGALGFSRSVVVKCILPEILDEPLAVERFIREATLSAQFHHPNIVEVLDLIKERDGYFIVMEYLDGVPLSKIIRRLERFNEGLSAGIVAYLGRCLGSALDYAHNFINEEGEVQCVVHRDVSPENIVIRKDGSIKLIDFGVAKDIEGTQLTQIASLVGKPMFIPAEAFDGHGSTPARDVYSMAMTLWISVTGRTPFVLPPGPEGLASLVVAIKNDPIPPMSALGLSVPNALEDAIRRGLARDPDARPTAAELSSELGELWTAHAPNAVRDLKKIVEEIMEEEPQAKPIMSQGSFSSRTINATLRKNPTFDPVPVPVPVSGEEEEGYISRPLYPQRKSNRRGILIAAAITGVGLVIALAIALAPRDPPPVPEPPLPAPMEARPPPVIREDMVENGTLVVECNNWREIWVDAKLVGMCPRVELSVEEGVHMVTVRGGSKKREREVNVRARQQVLIEFKNRRRPRAINPRP